MTRLTPEPKGTHVGALVTLDLADDSPVLSLPWIITFGPLDDSDEWEPVVCGPYERAHALALAETVVADEDLMAVVEPVLPHATVDEIRSEIASAQLAAESEEDEYELDEDEEAEGLEVSVDDESLRVDFRRVRWATCTTRRTSSTKRSSRPRRRRQKRSVPVLPG